MKNVTGTFALSIGFAALFLFGSSRAGADVSVLDGEWSGTVDIPGMTLGIDLSFADGAGSFSIPMQGVEGFAIENISVVGSDVTFMLGGGIPGDPTFALKLSDDSDEMVGTFSQSGGEFPASFTRTSEAEDRLSLADLRAPMQSFVDSMRAHFDIPGVTIALIHGADEATLPSGVRSIETEEPVTSSTQFAIGSSTKAFTATLLGALVDDGLVDWDDRVTDHLPDFELNDPVASEQMRVRDLLSHVSGLPRHDLLWYFDGLDRDELFERLRYLEPVGEIRDGFRYNNLMFLVAGMLAAEVGGASYEELLEARLLSPLGMSAETTLSTEELASQRDRATGHRLEEDRTVVTIPYRSLRAIAPAGSINASADGLLRWLRFNIDGSVDESDAVVSEATLRFIQGPEVVMDKETATPGLEFSLYGLGWMTSVYRGDRIVYHGGTIDGFDAQVLFVPERRIGIAVGANRNGRFPSRVSFDLLDMLLDREPFDHTAGALARRLAAIEELENDEESEDEETDESRVEGTSPGGPIEEYVGSYSHPAYDTVRITTIDDQLLFSYFEEESPLVHHHYEVFRADGSEGELDGSLLQFERDLYGTVVSFSTLVETTVSPVVFVRTVDERLSDPAYLARFTGEYALDEQVLEVSVVGSGLRVVVGGGSAFDLEPSGIKADGTATFTLEGMDAYSIGFIEVDGRVTMARLRQPNGTFEAERVD